MELMSRPSNRAKNLFGRELSARLALLGKSYDDLTEETDGLLYPKLLTRLATGEKPITRLYQEQYQALLSALEWTPQELARAAGEPIPEPDHPDEVPVRSIRIPIVDAGAGLPIWDPGHGEWIDVDLPDLRRYQRGDLFGVRVWGDSMLPTVVAGDIVVCARDERAENGRMVAAWVDDGLLIKRVLRDNGTVWLASDNVSYPPQRAKGDLRVFGVARALVREFK